MKKIKMFCMFFVLAILLIPVCFADSETDAFFSTMNIKMEELPDMNLKISNTEITQKLFVAIMGENQSYFKGENMPADSASWYDAIYFCNLLSEKLGLEPVYIVNGNTDVSKWNYTPLRGKSIDGNIAQDLDVSGFRLPTIKEWSYAALGGEMYDFAGSDTVDTVAWHWQNSDYRPHEVAQKKPNKYNLYDMSGNLIEWVWESTDGKANGKRRIVCGGCWGMYADKMKLNDFYYYPTKSREKFIGFRIVCKSSKNET